VVVPLFQEDRSSRRKKEISLPSFSRAVGTFPLSSPPLCTLWTSKRETFFLLGLCTLLFFIEKREFPLSFEETGVALVSFRFPPVHKKGEGGWLFFFPSCRELEIFRPALPGSRRHSPPNRPGGAGPPFPFSPRREMSRFSSSRLRLCCDENEDFFFPPARRRTLSIPVSSWMKSGPLSSSFPFRSHPAFPPLCSLRIACFPLRESRQANRPSLPPLFFFLFLGKVEHEGLFLPSPPRDDPTL